MLRRALILRQLDQGQKAAQVALNVGMAPKTVRAIARRYEEEGLESALREKPRPSKQPTLTAFHPSEISYADERMLVSPNASCIRRPNAPARCASRNDLNLFAIQVALLLRCFY